MKLMPQEIEVRYVIPSLRKEIAKQLVVRKHKQKDIAKMLNITPAAVSQYMKEKRGTINFDKELQKEIKKASTKIAKNPETMQEEMYKLTESVKKSGVICAIHKRYDRVPSQCDMCFYNANN